LGKLGEGSLSFYLGNFYRWTTGRNYPQVNLEGPPVGLQEGDDSDPFDEEKLERIFSGFFPPQ